jgi:hypothetical protein
MLSVSVRKKMECRACKNGGCAGKYVKLNTIFVINKLLLLVLNVKIAIFNTSDQSSAFNRGYGSWASEPKARTPTV